MFIRGERPIIDFKYDILKHPNVSLTTDGKGKPYKYGEVTIDFSSVSILDLDPSDIKDIASYLDYLMESFLFNNAKRYDVKGKKYFEYPSKYYCTDIGLRNARLNFRQQEETHIMENIIYNELISRGYLVDVGVVEIVEKIDENRVKKQCEIDFVVNKGTKKYYIQSALSVSDPDKLKTEIRPLLNTKDFFKKILISKTSMKPFVDENGILHLGLYEFLLNEDSLEL